MRSYIHDTLTNSEVTKLSLQKARESEVVQQRLGVPIEMGTIEYGTLQEGADGFAKLTIPLKGPKGEGLLHVDATMADGAWEFDRLEAELPGRPRRVDLLQSSALDH